MPDTAVALPYELAEELASDERFRLCRARLAAGETVLLKLPARQPPFAADLAQLKREYEILRAPPVDGVTKALDLVCADAHCALLLEDADDRPLAAITAARSAPVGWVLDYALQIVATLAGLHRAGIVHRALSPRSVLVNERSGRVRLTDFSDAARDATEACAPLAEHQYRTRLPYAAPEQTGRVNRACDWRTDFYAFGALLYELLVGHPPFVSDDPLELMHAQIARTPPAPAQIAAVPPPLSKIVMKLLAKQPEERYQSAHCLQNDLARCRREWAERGRIGDFAIAAADVTDRFTVPQRLYGREREHAALLDAFDAARRGPATLLLVEGAAGIGKTALIQELQEPVSRCRGNFVAGKFDQLSRDVPYAALIQALRRCVQRLLTEAPAQLARDGERIDAALGPNAAVIAEVIPEIELILGPQRPAPTLPPAEAQNRFTLAFQNFVAALARAEAPLAIFLDDLQWVDAATLQLLQALLASPTIRHLLVIGAWRANEVDGGHPLAPALQSLDAAGVPIRRISLAPLALPALTELAADTLHVAREHAQPLARVLLERTGGNPFFATQFLATLHRDGLIVFDPEHARWQCRLDAIAAAPADDVIELMGRKIDRLPPDTQRALCFAACLGNRFDAETLARVGDRPLRATVADLEAAVAEGLVVPEANQSFAFVHDRVQQAAYARIDAEQRPCVHLQVGRALIGSAGGDTSAFDRIFDAVSHLNLGAPLIDASEERLALARMNLAAGNKAKASAAFGSALGYFNAGIALLDAGHWQAHYELAFELNLEAAQCDYLCGNFDDALARIAELLRRAASDLDRARVHRLRAIQFENMARYADAIAAACDGLAVLGIALPASPRAKRAALAAEIEQIRARRAGRSIASLVDLPPMIDPSMRMVMKLLTDAWSSAYILGDATLARLISATLVRLSLAHGNAEESAYGYVTHAITAGPVNGDYGEAWDWGNLALAVNERFDDRRLRAKIYQQFHAHVNLWCRPFESCVGYARRASRAGLESGDFLYAAYGASTESWPAFAAAQDLARFETDLQPNLELLVRLKNDSFADALRLMLAWSRALQGTTRAPRSLSHDGFDEEKYVATYRGNAFFSMFHAIARLGLCVLLDDAEGAAQAARSVQATAHELVGMQWSVLYAFWNGLRQADAYAAADEAGRAAALRELRSARRALDALADSCPENFHCWALLLAAELARVTDRPLEALERYERAIAFAEETGSLQQAALANERCGRLWLERGNGRVAAIYLSAARDGYARWGAHAKVRRMHERHGDLLGGEPQGDAVPASAEALDIATIGKAAHALAADVELDTLLRQMLRIAIQSAGASRGALIELRDGEARVVAHGSADAGTQIELVDAPLDAPPRACSAAAVNYVLRTRAPLALAEVERDERFTHDAYLAAAQPKSVLCLPIVQLGRVRAVLYLENRLVRDAFRPERSELIQILAAQAAMSLHSARLLDRAKREMHERQRAEQQLRAIEAGTAAVTGGDFFRALVRNLAQALQVRYVFVAECLRDEPGRGRIVRTRAFWNRDDFGADFEFAVPGTPCEHVLDGEVCHYADDLQTLFPQDTGLAVWGAQSYYGMPLASSSGAVIGHMAVVDTRPMPDAALAQAVLRLSAGRAGAELERLRAHEGLQQALAEVEQLKNRLQEENVYLRRELIANVSHDLRSPLASLRGYLDTLLLKEKTLTAAERHTFLTIAQRQAEHLQTLISELFDLARLDFDGYRIEAEPLNLGELARDVLQKFQLAAQDKRIQLALEIDDELGFVHADIGLIERTLENLLENALAHTPAGGRVELAVLADDGDARIQVSDTGSGIPLEDLPHVFERFYRVDKARTLHSKGSGLGLAIVKRIVELHGSSIHVDSSVGAGTRFWFTLPLSGSRAAA